MRRITKIFNNNVVSAVDESGDEVVLVGAGVGYLRKRGQEVESARVEKEFRLTGQGRDGTTRVLVSLPYEVVSATSAVAEHLRAAHGIDLPPAVEVGLADHLWQAIRRIEAGIPLYNSMLWETKVTYPQEFTIALQVLDIVLERLGRRLPLDEAGFITLHLVNAGLVTDAGHAYSLARALRDVLEIVERDLGLSATETSASTARFLTHLKFVIQRLTQRRLFSGEFREIFDARRAQDPSGHACAVHIGDYLHRTFGTEISDEELMYLMFHLARLRADVAEALEPTPGSGAARPV